jgi:hypothetical protein
MGSVDAYGVELEGRRGQDTSSGEKRAEDGRVLEGDKRMLGNGVRGLDVDHPRPWQDGVERARRVWCVIGYRPVHHNLLFLSTNCVYHQFL